MSTDRLSNMVSSIKNASMAKKNAVEIPYSIECEKVAQILKKRGFLNEVKLFKPEKSHEKMIHLGLSEVDGAYVVTDARRVSKPGRRIYKGYKELKPSWGRFGLLVVSTPKGIMDSVEARKKKLGGEVLCEIF